MSNPNMSGAPAGVSTETPTSPVAARTAIDPVSAEAQTSPVAAPSPAAPVSPASPFEEQDAANALVQPSGTGKPRGGAPAHPGLLAMRCLAEFAGSALAIFPLLIVYTLSQLIYQYAGVTPIILVTVLSYGAVAALFGKVSGAQLNPAVTVAAMLTSKTGWIDGIAYIVAQVLGGIAAAALYTIVLPTSENVTGQMWFTVVVNGFDDASRSSSALSGAGISFGVMLAVAVELIAGLIVVGAAVSTLREDGTADSSHAWVTAVAYGLGAALTYPVTGAALNPARATGVAIMAHGKGLTVEPLSQLWVFWIAPVFAAALVAVAMIANQMVAAAAAKTSAPAQEQSGVLADASEPAQGTGSEQYAYGEVQGDQANAQSQTDEGVERH